jgi:hypothetical protein
MAFLYAVIKIILNLCTYHTLCVKLRMTYGEVVPTCLFMGFNLKTTQRILKGLDIHSKDCKIRSFASHWPRELSVRIQMNYISLNAQN